MELNQALNLNQPSSNRYIYMYVYIYVYMYMYIYTTHVFWCQTALLFHLTMGQLAPRIHSCLVRCPRAKCIACPWAVRKAEMG